MVYALAVYIFVSAVAGFLLDTLNNIRHIGAAGTGQAFYGKVWPAPYFLFVQGVANSLPQGAGNVLPLFHLVSQGRHQNIRLAGIVLGEKAHLQVEERDNIEECADGQLVQNVKKQIPRKKGTLILL